LSKGQIAIAELAKRVGPCDPAQGFRLIDAVLGERQAHLDLWEQLLMGIAFDRGVLIGAVDNWWSADADYGGETELADVRALLALEVPLISVDAQPSRLVRP
jgi:hypothetical protein